MIYNYCGIVFNSNIAFPFFYEDKKNIPDLRLIYTDSMEHFNSSYSTFFCRNNKYILNLGERGYYVITKDQIECHFKDIQYMYATISNLPFAVISIIRGMLPFHSSSFMTNDQRTILFLGEKGAGKTTIACLADKYNLGYIYGDDMVTVCKTNNQLRVNRGSKLMKVTSETAYVLDDNRISGEVYPGLAKNYYIPRKSCSKYNAANLDKIFLLHRGKQLSCQKVSLFLRKPLIMRHIVGISILEQYFSQKINNIFNVLNIYDVYNLTVPDTIYDLSHCLPDIINSTNKLKEI